MMMMMIMIRVVFYFSLRAAGAGRHWRGCGFNAAGTLLDSLRGAWSCYGHAMDMLWACYMDMPYGHAVDGFRRVGGGGYGSTSEGRYGRHDMPHGRAMDMLRVHAMDMLRVHAACPCRMSMDGLIHASPSRVLIRASRLEICPMRHFDIISHLPQASC